MASPSSSDKRWRASCLLAIALVCGSFAAGCSTVRPEDREILADPSMVFGNDGTAGSHEEHVMNNREGSFGGTGSRGGGCGCN